MQLNKFTDLGMRVLVLLYQHNSSDRVTVDWLAKELDASRNHLVKIIQYMTLKKWIRSFKGRGGGLLLDEKVQAMSIGVLIKTLEDHSCRNKKLIDCSSPYCPLAPICSLPSCFDQALDAFYHVLNHYFLKDVILHKDQHEHLLNNRKPIDLNALFPEKEQSE